MKNNAIGTVAVSNSKRPRARFNLSADLHTTMDFGSVIPGRVHLQIPNSKVVCSSKERLLCSPLLAPTMGRLGLKVYHNFVRMSDLTENFAPMLSQEAVSRGLNQFVPLSVPCIDLASLSLFVLVGSLCKVYKSQSDDSRSQSSASIPVYDGTSGSLDSDDDLSNLGLFEKRSFSSYAFGNAFALNPELIYGNTGHRHYIPLANPTNATFYSIDPSSQFALANANTFGYDLSDITLDSADYVIPLTVNSSSYYLAFRLSDYGKRLRKILIGCGYQVDFTSSESVSVLPLLAFYKSYFDVFGLTLYTNWEQSNAYRFLRSADLSAKPSLVDLWRTSWGSTSMENYFYEFVRNELGFCLYTDEQDFVSAHTRSNAVSTRQDGLISQINTDIVGTPNISLASSSVEAADLESPNGHAFINNVVHGQLDSELLKRLYRITNRNTVAGRRIAELLRAQGLGSYVDECKSDFIGSFDLPIEIFDGISQSDTYSSVSDSGAPLGERFGNGQASSAGKDIERSFVFECNEFGYWITLITVVPKGGYCESLDATLTAIDKYKMYNPEFDSLGMEFDPKSLVHGSLPFADFTASSGRLGDSFGLVPRYFRWKFGRNVANGDFTRRSVRDSFAAYYLDKSIDVGQRNSFLVDESSTSKVYAVHKLFKPVDLPIAGNVWRYPTRYPWIGRFDRIFNRIFSTHEKYVNVGDSYLSAYEFFGSSDDNFILHMIYDVQYFAPMLPVEDSFETYDDANKVNSSMSKA